MTFFFYYSKAIRRSLARRSDDADTDSHSDTEFVEDPDTNQSSQSMNEEQKAKMKFNNLELLEKRFVKETSLPFFSRSSIVLVWGDMKMIFIESKIGKSWFM